MNFSAADAVDRPQARALGQGDATWPRLARWRGAYVLRLTRLLTTLGRWGVH